MLSQALEVFEEEYGKKKDSMILGEYIPADGTYVIVEPESEGFYIAETFEIKIDKKTRKIDRTISEHMKFICLADYYSKVSDMNKAILSAAGKVIQGNNYLSFIIKKESLTNGKLSLDFIDKFYDTLEDPKRKYTKKQDLELYRIAEKKLGEVDREKLNRIRSWIKGNIFEEFKGISGKDYLKIFFHYPEEEYIREGERYLIPNIYNKNEYAKKSEGSIYGLPNDNMGLNSKKPYLENKTRKTNVPYLVSLEETLIQKKFFDYLMNQASSGRNNIYISNELKSTNSSEPIVEDFSGIFLRVRKGKEVEVQDYDVITQYSYNLKKAFEYRNELGIDHDRLDAEYCTIDTLGKMQMVINEVFFNKQLVPNYFTEPKDMMTKDSKLKYNILACRTALFNWFYKGSDSGIWKLLESFSMSLVKNSLEKGHFRKVCDQFNLRMSLKEYFEGGKGMSDTVLDIKNSLRVKISQKETGAIESDKEYLFAVGQLVSFFISKSKGKKKPLSLANPFINAKKDKVIKEKLKGLYKKYNYDIESWDYRFKGLYAMVNSYELNGSVDDDMVIAGYLHSNLLYEKLEKKDKNKEDRQEGTE